MGRDTLLMREKVHFSNIQIVDIVMGIVMQIYFLFPWLGGVGSRCNTLQYLLMAIRSDNMGELYKHIFRGDINVGIDNAEQIAQVFLLVITALAFLQMILLVYVILSVLGHRGRYVLHVLLIGYSYVLLSSDWTVYLIENMERYTLPSRTYLYLLIFFALCGLWIFFQSILQNQENREERLWHMEQMNVELERQVKREKEQVESLMDSYSEQRKLTHDFRNQLLALDGLLKRQEYQEMQVYLTQLLNSDIQLERVINTGNPMVDVLLGRAYKEAGQAGITVEFEVGNLQELHLQDDELVILLSNLLDNAIEAARKVEKEKRIILRLKQQDETFILTVLNTVAESQESGKTKNKLLHGYGLQNIERVLRRNGGDYAAQCKDGWYQFTAVIY